VNAQVRRLEITSENRELVWMQLFLSGAHVVQAMNACTPQSEHNPPADQSGCIEEREE
jgi:hypothetical protein